MANGRRNRSIYDSMYAPSPLEDLLASIPDKLIEMDRNRLQKKKYQDALTQQKFNNDRLMESDKFNKAKYEDSQKADEMKMLLDITTDLNQRSMILKKYGYNEAAADVQNAYDKDQKLKNNIYELESKVKNSTNPWEQKSFITEYKKNNSKNPDAFLNQKDFRALENTVQSSVNSFGDGYREKNDWIGEDSAADKLSYEMLESKEDAFLKEIVNIKKDLNKDSSTSQALNITSRINPKASIDKISQLENQLKSIYIDKVNLNKKYRRETEEEYNIRKANERNTLLSTSIARPGTLEYQQAVAAMTTEDQEKALVSRKTEINEDTVASLYNFNEEINENNIAERENNVSKNLTLILNDEEEGEGVVANDTAANLLSKVGVNTLQAGSPSQVVVDTSETKPVIEEVEIPQDGVSDEPVGEQISATDQNVYNPPGIRRNEVPRKYTNATKSTGKNLAKAFRRIKKVQDTTEYKKRTNNRSGGDKMLNDLKESFIKDTTGIYDADAKRFKYALDSDSDSFEDSLLRYPELNGFTNRAEVQEFLDFMSQLNNSIEV